MDDRAARVRVSGPLAQQAEGFCAMLAGCGYGQVTTRGKGSRMDRLPLPADAGQAIAGWLRGGRPGCSSRQVFTTLLAPLGPLTRKAGSAIVARAARRAGLAQVTAHRPATARRGNRAAKARSCIKCIPG